MITGLGVDVSLNFIMYHVWMQQTGTVIEYDANKVCVLLFNDITTLPITFCPSAKTIPCVDQYGCPHQKPTVMVLPNIEGLYRV